MTGQGVIAQETDSQAQSFQKEDSLLQVVSNLSDRIQKAEEETRNERIWKKRAKYFNIGYITSQTLTDKLDDEAEWKNDFVAKNATFQEFVQAVADKALKASVGHGNIW